jgi:hypothetical protein
MPKQVVAFVVLAAIGIGIGLMLWVALAGSGSRQVDDQRVIDREFSEDRFFAIFDVDGTGEVTFEVFEALYGTKESEDFLVSAGPGQPALSAREAFDALDKDGDGKITALDFAREGDRDWLRFQLDANRRGLVATSFRGRQLALGAARHWTIENEKAAEALGELPFHGSYFAEEHFGTWGEIIESDGNAVEGYIRENTEQGRLTVLTPVTRVFRYRYNRQEQEELPENARIHIDPWFSPVAGNAYEGRVFPEFGRVKRFEGEGFDHVGFILVEGNELFVAVARPTLRVFRTANVEYVLKPESPRAVYAERIRKHKFHEVSPNAELAANCVEWGLHREAIQLYLRVLTFDNTHQAAREYLGIRMRDGHFRPARR